MPAVHLTPAVLIVDDVEATRTGFVHLLELQGFRAVGAGDGAEALRTLRADASIRVVILDLAMPSTDGYWFRDEQRRDASVADIPVVVFSGMPLDPIPKSLAGVEVLAKPVALDRVIEIVARHCGSLGIPGTEGPGPDRVASGR